MKKLILMMLGVAFILGAYSEASYAKGSASQNNNRKKKKRFVYVRGDVFPWPWGSECPFPWREIEGTWMVKGEDNSFFNGNSLTFDVKKEDDGVKVLEIAQFDREANLRARGNGFSEKDKRVVKGIMTSEQTGKNYTVMVRSYSKKSKSCRSTDLVSAITFCPLRGKKCLQDSNYVLEKIENNK
jgi:hypothetical protein